MADPFKPRSRGIGATPSDWRCECGDLNRNHEAFCYRCGAGQPEGRVGLLSAKRSPVTQAWRLKLYRDDSTTPVVYTDVKHVFWTAGNTVLTIAQFTAGAAQEAHHYVHWPRERFAWYRLERQDTA